jgi:PKHD-type hydroxylase
MLLNIPGILSPSELESVRNELTRTTFGDGASLTAGASPNVKRNLQVPADSPAARKCSLIVLEALRRHRIFYSAALPLRVQGPLFNRYDPGMSYEAHVDNPIMGAPVTAAVRSDIAATLFLAAPEDYDGGELTVQDSYGVHSVKLPAGSVVVYPASSTHNVAPVTRGSRLVAVLWVQSLVRDESRRRALFELDLTIGALQKKLPGASELAALTGLYHNLLRMWAET